MLSKAKQIAIDIDITIGKRHDKLILPDADSDPITVELSN